MKVPLNVPPHAENFAYYVNVMLDDFSCLLAICWNNQPSLVISYSVTLKRRRTCVQSCTNLFTDAHNQGYTKTNNGLTNFSFIHTQMLHTCFKDTILLVAGCTCIISIATFNVSSIGYWTGIAYKTAGKSVYIFLLN